MASQIKNNFDDINIDVVKKKYYNANKVNAVLEDIREQALRLEEENRNLREQLESLSSRKEEIGDAILSAKTDVPADHIDACVQSEKLLNDSRLKAKQIIAAAQEKKEAPSRRGRRTAEYCVRHAEKLYIRHGAVVSLRASRRWTTTGRASSAD